MPPTPAEQRSEPPKTGWLSLLDRQPWIVFLAPMIVFMLLGALEPKPDDVKNDKGAEEGIWVALGIEYEHYPIVYTVKIGLTFLTVLAVSPGYRVFPPRVTWWSVLVGVVGGAVWIWLATEQYEAKALSAIGQWLSEIGLTWFKSTGERSAFNPLEQLAHSPAWMYTFLAVRLFGLIVLIAIVEEMFLRGFLMRFVAQPDWWKLPFGVVTPLSILVGTAVPMLMHPGELLAAAIWFTTVTWLMTHTRSIWDCVIAHAITNAILGVYVIQQGEWQLM